MIEMLAFLPPNLRHVGIDLFLEHLADIDSQEKSTQYLAAGTGIGGFRLLNGRWETLFASSFKETTPCYTCFGPQSVESHWALRKILCGDCEHDYTKDIFDKSQKMFTTWLHHNKFKKS